MIWAISSRRRAEQDLAMRAKQIRPLTQRVAIRFRLVGDLRGAAAKLHTSELRQLLKR